MKLIAYFAAGSAVAFGVVAAQTQDKVLTAALTVKTVGHTTAVHGKAADPKVGDFLFCIDQDRVGRRQADQLHRPRTRDLSADPRPRNARLDGGKTPESVASTLTVIAGTGEAWLFVAKGQAALQATRRRFAIDDGPRQHRAQDGLVARHRAASRRRHLQLLDGRGLHRVAVTTRTAPARMPAFGSSIRGRYCSRSAGSAAPTIAGRLRLSVRDSISTSTPSSSCL